ncbi:MAG: permease, partial [Gemmatimonadota bacterium]|nr:permease [Gemmatimonadota bacterium]
LNYTTVLDLVFLALAGILLRRFFKTGGPAMLRMMRLPSDSSGHGAGSGHPHGM